MVLEEHHSRARRRRVTLSKEQQLRVGVHHQTNRPRYVAEKLTFPINNAKSMSAQNGQDTSGSEGQVTETIPRTDVRPEYSVELCPFINCFRSMSMFPFPFPIVRLTDHRLVALTGSLL
jgi:hypothetical protein